MEGGKGREKKRRRVKKMMDDGSGGKGVIERKCFQEGKGEGPDLVKDWEVAREEKGSAEEGRKNGRW